MTTFFVLINGEQKGPYALDQLRSMWQNGTVTTDTLYWSEGMPDWLPLSGMSEQLHKAEPKVGVRADLDTDPNHVRRYRAIATLLIAGTIVAGVALYNSNFGASSNPVSGLLRLSTSELQDKVEHSIRETWDKNPETEHISIKRFSLIHKAGNQYDGLLEADVDGKTLQFSVDVTYDGERYMWQIRR